MSVEMAAVVFDGTHAAEKELSRLRTERDDAWLDEVSVLEHHTGGRFSVKATSPDYGDADHFHAGLAIGAGTGLLLGMIAGPLGILLWSGIGAMAGGAIGAQPQPGAFDPLVDRVKEALPRGSSALILVAENETAEHLVTAVGGEGRQTLRQALTEEQIEELKLAAVAPPPEDPRGL